MQTFLLTNVKSTMRSPTLLSFLFFLIGLTSTWQAVQIPVFGVQISLYNVVIILLTVYYLIKFRWTYLQINDKWMALYIICTIFSTLSANLFLPNVWISESVKATLKFIIVFAPFVFIFHKQVINDNIKSFYTGLKISIFIQACWSVLQLIFWYALNRVLNQEIFGDLLHIQITNASWLTWHGGFRATGISWEAANLGICMVVGFFLTKKYILRILYLTILLFSGSRTALLSLLAALIIAIIHNSLKYYHHLYDRTFIFALFSIIAIILLLLILFRQPFFQSTLISLSNRIAYGFNGEDIGTNRHMDYYFRYPDVLSDSNMVQFLFGFGTSCAGWPYTFILNPNPGRNIAWNPETDFVTLIVGNGILGFIFYYTFVFSLFKKCAKNKNYVNLLIALLVASSTYLYLRTWVTLLLIIMSLQYEYIYSDNDGIPYELKFGLEEDQ